MRRIFSAIKWNIFSNPIWYLTWNKRDYIHGPCSKTYGMKGCKTTKMITFLGTHWNLQIMWHLSSLLSNNSVMEAVIIYRNWGLQDLRRLDLGPQSKPTLNSDFCLLSPSATFPLYLIFLEDSTKSLQLNLVVQHDRVINMRKNHQIL